MPTGRRMASAVELHLLWAVSRLLPLRSMLSLASELLISIVILRFQWLPTRGLVAPDRPMGLHPFVVAPFAGAAGAAGAAAPAEVALSPAARWSDRWCRFQLLRPTVGGLPASPGCQPWLSTGRSSATSTGASAPRQLAPANRAEVAPLSLWVHWLARR
jgi:hypothetical protein